MQLSLNLALSWPLLRDCITVNSRSKTACDWHLIILRIHLLEGSNDDENRVAEAGCMRACRRRPAYSRQLTCAGFCVHWPDAPDAYLPRSASWEL